MKMYPHPDYQVLWNLPENLPERLEIMKSVTAFEKADTTEFYDLKVPGINNNPEVQVRVYRHKNRKDVPMVMNIHGGGFRGGPIGIDDPRCIAVAEGIGCTVVSVAYRTVPDFTYPAATEDCYAVLKYVNEHPDDFGVDGKRNAVYATSAGGAIAAGLCLYVRDKGGPKIAMQVLNFPTLDYLGNTTSYYQFKGKVPFFDNEDSPSAWPPYLGGFEGSLPSYYAVPSLARDLSGLPAACVITCEYDPLRDEGIKYAQRLMEFGVPTELYCLPRTTHSYDLVSAPLTKWMRQGITSSLKREFGITE